MLGKIEVRRKRGRQRMRQLDGLDGHEFEQAPEVGDEEGGLVFDSQRGHKKFDVT